MKTEFNGIPITYNERQGHSLINQYNFGNTRIAFYNEEQEDIICAREYLVCLWHIKPKKQ